MLKIWRIWCKCCPQNANFNLVAHIGTFINTSSFIHSIVRSISARFHILLFYLSFFFSFLRRIFILLFSLSFATCSLNEILWFVEEIEKIRFENHKVKPKPFIILVFFVVELHNERTAAIIKLKWERKEKRLQCVALIIAETLFEYDIKLHFAFKYAPNET